MALRIQKRPRKVPQGGWRFPRDPSAPLPDNTDSKAMIFGGDIGELISKVAEYRIINSLPLGNVNDEVHDWACRNLPVECVPVRPRGFGTGILVKGAELARFISAMATWLSDGGYGVARGG